MTYNLKSEDGESIVINNSLISYHSRESKDDSIYLILPLSWFRDNVHDSKGLFECKNCLPFYQKILNSSKKDWWLEKPKDPIHYKIRIIEHTYSSLPIDFNVRCWVGDDCKLDLLLAPDKDLDIIKLNRNIKISHIIL